MRARTVSRRAAAAALAAAGLAVTATAAAAPGPSVSGLRTDRARASAAIDAATLQLYALDSRQTALAARLSALRDEAAALGREQVANRAELAAARRTLDVARRQLEVRLRALYERGDPDPVAVLLGAQNLDEAITGLDDISRSAGLDRSVVSRMSAARDTLRRQAADLAARARRLQSLLADAAAVQGQLAALQADRRGYIASLSARRSLDDASIARAEAQARAAEQQSQQIAAQSRLATSSASFAASVVPAVTRPVAPAPAPTPTAPTTAAAAGGRQLTVDAVAYHLPGRTASGLPVGMGVVAVDPTVIPLGTKLYVPGYGNAVAADVGTAIKGLIIDLWYPSTPQAMAWGRRTVTITVYG